MKPVLRAAAHDVRSDRADFQEKDLRNRSRAEHLLARFTPNTPLFFFL